MRAISFVVGLSGAVASGVAAVPEPAAAEREFDQRIWRHEHGLPDNRVKAILQTRDGYLWIATQRGLARFDGQKFTVFDHFNTPALLADDCYALVEDRDGNLWGAAWGITFGGLFRRQAQEFTWLGPESGVTSLSYWCGICPRRRGGVVACSGSLWIYGSKAAPQGLARFAPVEKVLALDEGDEPDTLWFCTGNGLVHCDETQSRFEFAPLGQAFERLPTGAIWRSPAGERWVVFTARDTIPEEPGTRAWLTCFKNGRWLRPADLAQPDFHHGWQSRFIAPDGFGALWLPGVSNGVHRFIKGQFRHFSRPRAEPRDYVLCAHSDREGNLWLGTEQGGLERWTPRKVITYTTKDGLADDQAWTVCEARDGSVWLGTESGVTQVKDGCLTNFPLPDLTFEDSVRALAQDRDGAIWVGTIRSLKCIRNSVISEVKFPGEWFETKIRALLPAKAGGLWVGTVRGLTRLHNGARTKYTQADGLGSEEVRALLEDGGGDLWVGTLGGGLSRLHDGHFATYSITNGLSSTNVWALLEDADGVLWAGTDNGLNRFKDGRITSFGTDAGLPARNVNCLLEDDFGRLWVSHDRGLYWVRKQEFEEVASGRRKKVLSVPYDESDGLLTTAFSGQKSFPAGCKARDGRLWFPTAKGFAVIDPAKARFDEVPPLTVIEQVRANGQTILGSSPSDRPGTNSPPVAGRGRSKLRLPPGGGRVLEIRYTANTFIAADKARFQYRLRGFEDRWVEAGTRRDVYFNGLRPGDYEFEVVACNHHGVWPERGATFAFALAPLYYQTWWFYPSCVFGAVGLAAWLITWRVREVRKLQQLEHLKVLSEQRKQIARDIHDDLGASLTHILQLSSESNASPRQASTAPPQHQQIAALAGEAVENINEIVWATNPRYDTLPDLVAYLREYAAQFFAAASVPVRFEFPATVPPQRVTGAFRRHLLLLVKEALRNIVKHAEARQVCLGLVLRDRVLELRISDDGRGFGQLDGNNGGHGGNGLNNMRQRAAALNGSLTLESAPGKGTQLRATIPLG